MSNRFVFQDGTPIASPVPVVTGNEDSDTLLAIKSQFLQLQFQAAQKPNPSYNVHGHRYSLTEYQEFLVRSIAAINRLLQAQDPFEIATRVVT
jgi:hypothetical protein